MSKLVVLSLGNGDLHHGFPNVSAQVWEENCCHPMKFTGSLPAMPALIALYHHWQLLYLTLYQRLHSALRIKVAAADLTNVSEIEFGDLCQQLSDQLNLWLKSESFRPIDQQLRTYLQISDEIRIIIETTDCLLQQLPWHLWVFVESYPKAEVAISVSSNYQRSQSTSPPSPVSQSPAPIRILAVLGDSQGIDVSYDRAQLEQISPVADLTFLVEPGLEALHDHLWQDWDILFFAGHSYSREVGVLQINPTCQLSLEQLKYGLQHGIDQGLKLAIFNSCDGLGLARSLAELHIPQVIVMREVVPDGVAQKFLKDFLTAFSGGKSLYTSTREAREKLQSLEETYPCASWLPVICQNPAEEPMVWQTSSELLESDSVDRSTQRSIKRSTKRSPPQKKRPYPLKFLLSLSLISTTLIIGIRSLGLLQGLEIQAYDHLMRQRPEEVQDQRLLIVEITEDDYQLPQQAQRTGSLSDLALAQLLEKLSRFQPRVIGLDIYRDFSVRSDNSKLTTYLRESDHFFTICKVSDRTTSDPGIAPMPEVPIERHGFGDVLNDPDNILRRHLIAMQPSPTSLCKTPYALSVQLAFHYLATEGISASFTPEGQLKLGTLIIPQLRNHHGGYQQVDAWGYQILLNYRTHRSPLDIAPTVTLTQLLTDQVQAHQVRDRIVLIGVSAPSAKDYLTTPYRTDDGSRHRDIPGVVMQAQLVSQLISAVKDSRPLIHPRSFQQDVLWVWVWSMVGGMVAGCDRPKLHRLLVGAFAIGGLYLLCFYLLLQGLWVPLVPAALACITTGSWMITVGQTRKILTTDP